MATDLQQPDAPETTPSSVDLAYDEMLRRIVFGELTEGAPIKGSSITKEMGLSRTPVVQAIAKLCSEGLATQELNHRATVAEGAGRWFLSLHEVRILLEPAAAATAATSMSSEVVGELHRLANNFENAQKDSRREAAFLLDRCLHISIAEASGNLMIESIIRKCMDFKRFAYQVPNDPPERLERSHREHLEILKALEQRDSEMASTAMLFHLRSTFRELPDTHVV